MSGAGEPPTPGMSNRITGRWGSSASTNGWRSSRLTPMPLHSSSGGAPVVPSRAETRRARPPTVMTRIRSGFGALRRPRTTRPRPVLARPSPGGAGLAGSVVIDIGAWSVANRQQPAAAQLRGCGFFLPAPFGQPADVVRPPGPLAGLRAAQPVLRVFRALLPALVPGLFVAWRI